MDSSVLNKLKIVSWELDIDSLTMRFCATDTSESVSFLEWQEQIQHHDRDFVVNQILDTINQKRSYFDCQFRSQGKDSVLKYYRIRGLPVQAQFAGKFARLHGVLEDYTASENRMQDLQKRILYMETQAKEKNEFFASITHELRTPMSGVVGLAELMLESTGLSDDHRDLLLSIRQCGFSLLSIVNDTLDLSKLEARKLVLAPRKFELSKAIADIELLLSAKISERGQIFVVVIEKDVPKVVVADLNRLQQILVNLIGNALKFTPDGGGICLRIELVKAFEGNATLLFSVADSGIGIKSENQQGIFDEYAQENDDTSAKYGGTGLGLSIARELVALFGGALKVRSEPGRGTVFQFTIKVACPAVDFDMSHIPEDKIEPLEVRSLKILLAEDNLVNQKVASRMLEKAGHQVTLVNNGEEAVAVFQKQSFDMILMDIQMPIMSGDNATRLIREQEELNKNTPIPIIALTAHAMSGDREKYLALGMNDYLTKPIERDLLMEAVAKCAFEIDSSEDRSS
jgi:two-component system, sensor histidine kinase